MSVNGLSLVNVNNIRAQLSNFEREKGLEEFWAAQIPGKLAYKDFFVETPDMAHRSAVRQFNGWLKSYESKGRDMILLLNLEHLMAEFMGYMVEKKVKTAEIFAEDEECRGELRAFMAVKILEAKVEEERRGEPAFFSPFARKEVTRRAFLKDSRGFMHEAINAFNKGVRDNPDRLGDLQDEDTAKIMRLFEVIG